jgi:hypothetical protein
MFRFDHSESTGFQFVSIQHRAIVRQPEFVSEDFRTTSESRTGR